MRILDKVVVLRRGEATTAWLMFAYSFLAMTSYNIVKPVTQSKFIDGLGALYVPLADLAAGVIIGILMQGYLKATGRIARQSIIPVSLVGLALVLAVFWGLFQTGSEWVAAGLYVFGRLFGILLISQFWTLANDIYDARQARRIFGFIGGGASLGGIAGGSITTFTASAVGTTNLLLVGAAVLILCLGIVVAVSRRQPDTSGGATSGLQEGVGASEAIGLLRQSRHLRLIAAVIGFAAIASVVISQQLYMAAEAAKTTESDLTAFLGSITAYLSGVSFIVQVGLTSRVHRSLGLTFALLLLPMGLGGAAVVILLSGALWAPAMARVLDASLRYSIDKTTREVLFLPLPAEIRDRAKPFIDVTVDRLGKAAGSLLVIPLIWPELLGLDWVTLSYASLALVAVWVGVAVMARHEYLRSFRRGLDTRNIEPDALRPGAVDVETLETLIEGLSSPDETAVLYAIEMLERLDKRHLVTPLLLHHESAAVRSRVLGALEAAGPVRAEPWIPAVNRLLRDPDAEVRAAAVRALAALRGEDAAQVLERCVHDPEPRVAVAAAVELADSPRAEHVALAETALTRLVEDTRSAANAGRRHAAAALAHIRQPSFRSLLVPLIHDQDVGVAREAIASTRAAGADDPRFLPPLVSRLGHRELKSAARDALIAYGEPAVAFLRHALLDPDEHVWVRRHVPATLARIPAPAALDALVAGLDQPDGFLRYKILEAIEWLQRDEPNLALPAAVLEKQVVQETARYCSHLSLRANLLPHDAGREPSLLIVALNDKLDRTLDRVFRLLALRYPGKDVAAAQTTLRHTDGRRRAGALEYLDNILMGAVRKRVMPLVDEAPMDDKVRFANGVLKSRPRDLDDTLAQLVHDADPVVTASAIQFAVRHGRARSFADDFEHLVVHRGREAVVRDAARWGLRGGTPGDASADRQLPVVELADRLRAMPLFGFVSVDELFRIAGAASRIEQPTGYSLTRRGARPDEVLFLLDGAVCLNGDAATVSAPATLGLADVLEGRAIRHDAVVTDPVTGLALDASRFLTMLSDNIAMARGLFRMLLPDDSVIEATADTAGGPAAGLRSAGPGVGPVEKARLLRLIPLFSRATVDELAHLVAVTREVRLDNGGVLWDDQGEPAIIQVLDGEVLVEDDGGSRRAYGPGGTIGLRATLTGSRARGRAVVTRAGRALRIDRDDLFAVLADQGELLQGVFSAVLEAVPAGTADASMLR